jgi:adenosylcobinamide kinase/adenosylcobinamide-phosphate guanylyltransferase
VACTTFVLGGVRSGKSRFALDAHVMHARVTFVATGLASDPEMAERIERHRRERPSRWPTVEAPYDLVPRVRDACAAADAVVVDCLGVWVANLMLRGDPEDHVLKQADELASLLRLRLADVTVVSNEVGLGVHPTSEAGRHFRVVLMIAGQPLTVKDTRV